ncbi:MAG: hypothetical protein ABL973_14530 [Micropepsaceae bacterium]
MTRISPEAAEELFGISASHEVMDSGERRFRLIDQNGLGYVRTEAGSFGGWQNSHFHKLLVETYIVQSGWIAVATISENSVVEIEILKSGNIWTAPIDLAHNVYMAASSVTHTVKHGVGSANDWQTSIKTIRLDAMTKHLDAEQIFALAISKRI